MNVLPQRHRKVATVDAASDGQIEDPMLREKDAFRVQFLYMSPLGITRPIEGATIFARDIRLRCTGRIADADMALRCRCCPYR